MNNEAKEWLNKASEDLVPKLKGSAIYAGIVGDAFLKDPACALQLGYAILLDKPIILIVDKKTKIPESLVKVAQVIERVDLNNEADMKRATESMAMFARNR